MTQTPPQAPYAAPQGPAFDGTAYPPQGYPPLPPPAPEKKPFYKKGWFIAVAALAVIGIGSANSDGGDGSTAASDGAGSEASAAGDTGTEASTEVPSGADAPVAFGIGQDAADGKFNFVVKGVDCSRTQIGSEYFNTTAQGKFCVVNVAITNIGDEPQSFFGENAKLFNAQGQQFSADNEAAMYLENADSLFEEINPGNSLNSKVIFDVPANMKPTSIELHDSAFSGGVTVALK